LNEKDESSDEKTFRSFTKAKPLREIVSEGLHIKKRNMR